MTGSEIYGIYIESLDNIKDIIDFIQPWPEAAQRDVYNWNSMSNLFHLHRQTAARHPAADLDVQSES